MRCEEKRVYKTHDGVFFIPFSKINYDSPIITNEGKLSVEIRNIFIVFNLNEDEVQIWEYRDPSHATLIGKDELHVLKPVLLCINGNAINGIIKALNDNVATIAIKDNGKELFVTTETENIFPSFKDIKEKYNCPQTEEDLLDTEEAFKIIMEGNRSKLQKLVETIMQKEGSYEHY